VQADGKIGVSLDRFLQRYNPDGSHDVTFGANGTVNSQPYNSIAVQKDGKIGGVWCIGGGIVVARHNADGTLDPTFNGGGSHLFNRRYSALRVEHTARRKIRRDCNNSSDASSAATTFDVWRLNPDGSPT